MTLLAPLAILFGLTLPAILAMYILKVRRPRQEISSTFLWRSAVKDLQATTPWQRLRRSWLLLLQLLIALLLTAALIRPATHVASSLAGHTIIVIDRSATMQATDVVPTRFEQAKRGALDLIGQMGSSNRITLITLDAHPRVLASSTGDAGPLRDALSTLSTNLDAADLQSALSLATSAGGTGRQTRVVLFTDGITAPYGGTISLPFGVETHIIGTNAENCAIAYVSVSGQTTSAPQISVHVSNLGAREQNRTLEVRVDGHLIDAKPITVAAGGGTDLTVPAPQGTDHADLRLTPADAFPADDTATAVLRPPQTYNVTLVTAKNVFLEHALSLRPDITLTTIGPAAYKPDSTVDLYVFDGFLPSPMPAVPHWIVAPPQDPGLGTGVQIAPGPPRPDAAGEPLLFNVDLSGVHIARTRDLRTSTVGRAVIDSAGGPLLLVNDASPHSAVLGFDIHESDLPLQAAFPILVDHLSHYLLPGAVGLASPSPGDAVPIVAGGDSTSVSITKPDGSQSDITVTGAAGVFAATDQLGLYHVTSNGSRPLNAEFAVNLFDPLRSSLQPQSQLRVTTGAADSTNTVGDSTSEWWPWIAVIALILLLGEWVVFNRAA